MTHGFVVASVMYPPAASFSMMFKSPVSTERLHGRREAKECVWGGNDEGGEKMSGGVKRR